MARKGKFAIPTLLAAGLTPFAAAGSEEPLQPDNPSSLFESLKKIVWNIGDSHQFTLAQHRSHGSHESHQSHRSHGYRLTPGDAAEVMQASVGSRNEASTPASSILPSTPAIAKKLKVLPGNSTKFHDLVTQMQLSLLARGYEVGDINGELHARTIAALYRYQANSGLVPSGKISNNTLSSLGIIAR